MGFTRVRVLENGWSRWRRRGFPIESADATTKN
jgi:3-mercaptopyruvate sulfurtransferase SseA